MDWAVFVILVHCLAIDSVTTTSTSQQSNIGSICQSQINRHKNTCYWIETTKDTVPNLREKCTSKGGNLAAIDSQETSNFVIHFLNSLSFSGDLWIGYEEPNQRWDDGSPFLWRNYRRGEPNKHAERCTMMWRRFNWQWNDGYCHKYHYGLCQIRTYGPNCLLSYQGSKYRGQTAVTQDGLTCQAWAAQERNHSYTNPALFPDKTLEDAANYCRNPDKRPEGPWCYTNDPAVKWGFCDIPMCTKTTTDPPAEPDCLMSDQGSEYQGQTSVTRDGRTCQAWAAQKPHKHKFTGTGWFPDERLEDTVNYCRNPDGRPEGPWCYTTDPDINWGYCGIPVCTKTTANTPTNSAQPQGIGLTEHLIVSFVLIHLIR